MKGVFTVKGKVIAVSISEKKGERKKNVDKVFVKKTSDLRVMRTQAKSGTGRLACLP